MVQGQAGHELERAGDLDRGAVLQHVDPAVRGCVALGVAAIADEHPAVAEGERRQRLQPGSDELNFVTIGRAGGGGPELALAAGTTSAKVRVAARPATAITRLDMTTPDLNEGFACCGLATMAPSPTRLPPCA